MNCTVLPIEQRINTLLVKRGLTMGTAESCTGGRIASLVTSVPGSSAGFIGGIVSYGNDVKCSVLGVSEASLAGNGAVSREVVEQMALGAVRVLKCDCAVAASGIAGPAGGTPDKPVGTVWIAAVAGERIISKLYHFQGDRRNIVEQSAIMALQVLESLLAGIPEI